MPYSAFSAVVRIIGINPYVTPPAAVRDALFAQAQKETSPIPVRGTLNDHAFTQTLVKYAGAWRLYLNGPMLKAAKLGVGDRAHVEIAYDPTPRTTPVHPLFAAALKADAKARAAFDALIPSRQKEILRYLQNLKSDASVARNVEIFLKHLRGDKTATHSALMRKR
jgi:hypothetical protein